MFPRVPFRNLVFALAGVPTTWSDDVDAFQAGTVAVPGVRVYLALSSESELMWPDEVQGAYDSGTKTVTITEYLQLRSVISIRVDSVRAAAQSQAIDMANKIVRRLQRTGAGTVLRGFGMAYEDARPAILTDWNLDGHLYRTCIVDVSFMRVDAEVSTTSDGLGQEGAVILTVNTTNEVPASPPVT